MGNAEYMGLLARATEPSSVAALLSLVARQAQLTSTCLLNVPSSLSSLMVSNVASSVRSSSVTKTWPTSLSTPALSSTCPLHHFAPCAGREPKLSEISSMALTPLNPPTRNSLFGSNLRSSSAGPRVTTAGSTSKPCEIGEGHETYHGRPRRGY